MSTDNFMIGEFNSTGIESKELTAAELYQVQPYYQRFDQKNNMTRQPFWNPKIAESTHERNENLIKLIESDKPGYSLIDWAFYSGALANMLNNGFRINWPNRRGNSWQPLNRLPRLDTADIVDPVFQSLGKLSTDPATTARLVRKVSRLWGADEVGFCQLDRRWVYSHWFDEETKEHYPIKFSDEPGYEKYLEPAQLEDRTQVIPDTMKYVIVLIHEMDKMGIDAAPTLTQMGATHTVYSKISFSTVMIAEFIRGLGYNAIPSANDTALSIPLAIDAGLGELGRNGKLITPRFGPRCRISKVITDLPVSVGHVKPWGVTEFCTACRKCAENCPAGAISMGERSFEPSDSSGNRGVLVWPVNNTRCYTYWEKIGTNCGICIRTCPFNKSKYWSHNFIRYAIRRKSRIFDSFLVQMDNLFGYGKFRKAEEFWSS